MEITMTPTDYTGQCTHQDFEPLLDQNVTVSNGNTQVSMKVSEVASYPERQMKGLRVPFTLLLDPANGEPLAEFNGQPVQIEHEKLENLSVVGNWVTVPDPTKGPQIMFEIAFG